MGDLIISEFGKPKREVVKSSAKKLEQPQPDESVMYFVTGLAQYESLDELEELLDLLLIDINDTIYQFHFMFGKRKLIDALRLVLDVTLMNKDLKIQIEKLIEDIRMI